MKKNAFTLAEGATHTNMLQRVGNEFSLAEVLITLAIIGVVAAMTIPTLIAKINNIVTDNQQKVLIIPLINLKDWASSPIFQVFTFNSLY